MLKDKRAFERIDGIVNVRYSVKGRDKDKNESLPRNIGGGGVGICLPEKLQPGTIIELEITVPDNPEKAIFGVGQVLWTKPFGVLAESVDLFETGIKFVNINPLAVGRVYTYERQMSLE